MKEDYYIQLNKANAKTNTPLAMTATNVGLNFKQEPQQHPVAKKRKFYSDEDANSQNSVEHDEDEAYLDQGHDDEDDDTYMDKGETDSVLSDEQDSLTSLNSRRKQHKPIR